MRVGLDFDNTIVEYDALFHRVALEGNAIDSSVPVSKVAVRDYLRRQGKEDFWTEMQGRVYGARMSEATAFAGIVDVLRRAIAAGHTLYIVSHKTKYPFLGPAYDLHAAAEAWITKNLHDSIGPLIPDGQIYFELTKELKLQRIAKLQCDVFVDDLPEILLSSDFPRTTQPVLFDPENRQSESHPSAFTVIRRWDELEKCLSR